MIKKYKTLLSSRRKIQERIAKMQVNLDREKKRIQLIDKQLTEIDKSVYAV